MRFSLRPDRVFDGYEQIEGQELARRGIRLLLCDLDYTLAPKSQREPDETVRRWIGQMRQAGVEVMILSNNRSPARVEQFGAKGAWNKVLHALQRPWKAAAREK